MIQISVAPGHPLPPFLVLDPSTIHSQLPLRPEPHPSESHLFPSESVTKKPELSPLPVIAIGNFSFPPPLLSLLLSMINPAQSHSYRFQWSTLTLRQTHQSRSPSRHRSSPRHCSSHSHYQHPPIQQYSGSMLKRKRRYSIHQQPSGLLPPADASAPARAYRATLNATSVPAYILRPLLRRPEHVRYGAGSQIHGGDTSRRVHGCNRAVARGRGIVELAVCVVGMRKRDAAWKAA